MKEEKPLHSILLATSQTFSGANFYLPTNYKPQGKNCTFCNIRPCSHIPDYKESEIFILFNLSISLQIKAGRNVSVTTTEPGVSFSILPQATNLRQQPNLRWEVRAAFSKWVSTKRNSNNWDVFWFGRERNEKQSGLCFWAIFNSSIYSWKTCHR